MDCEVSIIVPCFNQAQYLNDLLVNVNDATSRPYEVIVIDDGSTSADSNEIFEGLTAFCSRQALKVVRQPNAGLSGARNTGLKLCAGKFVQFLDSDDLLVAGKIDEQISVLEKFGAEICVDDYVLFDESRFDMSSPPVDTIGRYELTFEDVALFWEREMSIPIHCALFRKEVVTDILFDEGLRGKEDWVFWLNLMARDPACVHRQKVGAIYRQHGQSMTKSSAIAMGVMWLLAINKNAANHPKRFTDKHKIEAINHFASFYSRHMWLKFHNRLPEKIYNSAIIDIFRDSLS